MGKSSAVQRELTAVQLAHVFAIFAFAVVVPIDTVIGRIRVPLEERTACGSYSLDEGRKQ